MSCHYPILYIPQMADEDSSDTEDLLDYAEEVGRHHSLMGYEGSPSPNYSSMERQRHNGCVCVCVPMVDLHESTSVFHIRQYEVLFISEAVQFTCQSFNTLV